MANRGSIVILYSVHMYIYGVHAPHGVHTDILLRPVCINLNKNREK